MAPPEIFETRSLKIKKYTFLRVKNDFFAILGFPTVQWGTFVEQWNEAGH